MRLTWADSGASSTDDVTKNTALTLDGTAEKGASVKVYDGETLLGSATAETYERALPLVLRDPRQGRHHHPRQHESQDQPRRWNHVHLRPAAL